eukprot:7084538-Pyramimonas_sp.AAC.1
MWRDEADQISSGAVYIVAEADQALVDPGAGSDLVGVQALNREAQALATHGLTYVEIPRSHRPLKAAHGIGGMGRVISA